MTGDICYGDNVRIRRTPETERLGIAETIGNVYGETTPSESGVEVVGELRSDYALNVYFESRQKSHWFAPELLEFVDHAPGTEVHVHGSPFKSVRQRDGSWKDVPVAPGAAARPGDTLAAQQSRRRLLAAVLLAALGVASFLALRWIWRDITYWSRSVTVEYGTATLEACVRRLPERAGVRVQETPDPQVARIVVFGHGASVSHPGPASEESAEHLLQDMKLAVAARCGGPELPP